jgi:PHD/YefM family antitoxin component YafN of YafNO toxin-antitoxin module
MTTQIMKSDEARVKWRDVLESAMFGNDTVIERYNRPTAVVIPFDDYTAILEALEDYRAGQRAEAAHQEWLDDPESGEDWETVKAELIANGLLTSD